MKKLNLGCGLDYREGWVNIDCRSNVKLDVRHNLEKFPYPFKKDEFDEIRINHVLEHLNDPIRVLKECIRICKNGAKIVVNVPHAYAYSQVASIQHKANFTEYSFIPLHIKEYDLEELRLVRQEFIFKNKWKKFIPFKKYLTVFLNGIYDDLHFKFIVNKIRN